MHVYFLRHGETDLNRRNVVQGRSIDSNLNELGRAQAEAFFKQYQHVNFELVVTSCLQRTHQTVARFLDRDIPWHQTADLDEISWGAMEGSLPNPERDRAFNEVLQAWRTGDVDAAFPGGESARQLDDRVGHFLDWLQKRPEQQILVATHGRTLRILIARLKGLLLSEVYQVELVNTGCYHVQFTENGVIFHLENDIKHLRESGLLHIAN